MIGPGVSGLATTALVLLVLAAAAWLLRRGTLGVLPLGRNRARGFNVETAFSLGERRSLAVVSIEGRRLLLGLTPVNISLISELPPAADFKGTLERHTEGGRT
jgi:flagellar protein FliO/FliZ